MMKSSSVQNRSNEGINQAKISEAIRRTIDLYHELALSYSEMEAAADSVSKAVREVIQGEDLGIEAQPY